LGKRSGKLRLSRSNCSYIIGMTEGAKLEACAIERVAGGLYRKDEHVQAGGWKVFLLLTSRLSSSESDKFY